MLDQIELMQVRDYVLDVLPELLHDEEVAIVIEGMLAERFPRRDEFARLLDELTAQRQENNWRFNKLDHRLETQRQETKQRFDDLEHRLETQRQETKQRFTQVDARFDNLEHRLEAHRQETRQNFQEVRQDIANLQNQAKAHRRETLQIKRNVAKLQVNMDILLDRIERFDNRLNLLTGQSRVEKGEQLEDVVAKALRYGLENPSLATESIRLRQKLVDKEGLVFEPGYITEVDLLAENDKLTVFEVKATADPDHPFIFSRKIKLIAAQNPDKKVEGVLISPYVSEEVRERCLYYGIKLVS